jgi:hypothetical protein
MGSYDVLDLIREAYQKTSPKDLKPMGCTYGNSDQLSFQAVTVAFLWMKEVKTPKFKLIDREGILEIQLLPNHSWQDITNTQFKYIVYYWFMIHRTGSCKGVYIFTNDGPLFILTNPEEDLEETYRTLHILKRREIQAI